MSDIINIDTANKMIPLLESIVGETQKLWKQIRDKRKVLDTDNMLDEQSRNTLLEHLHRDTERLTEILDEVENLGCTIESYGEGIIGIPSSLDGRHVLLCWRSGEDKIQYYHSLDQDHHDRVLIEGLLE